MNSCKYCKQPTQRNYEGVCHTQCHKQHKRLEWKNGDATKKQQVEGDMKTLTLLERIFG